jgi:hypothetical protein
VPAAHAWEKVDQDVHEPKGNTASHTICSFHVRASRFPHWEWNLWALVLKRRGRGDGISKALPCLRRPDARDAKSWSLSLHLPLTQSEVSSILEDSLIRFYPTSP